MHTCESWHIPTHLESQVNICEDSHHLDATGAEVMGSLVFSRDADPCKNNGVARIFTKSSGKGIAETVQTMILYETRPDEPGGCRPLRLIDKRTEAMLWCSKSYIIDLLQPKLQPCLEQERITWQQVQPILDELSVAEIKACIDTDDMEAIVSRLTNPEELNTQPKKPVQHDHKVGPGHSWQHPCTLCRGAYRLLHQILSDTREEQGLIENLHVRSSCGNGLRFEFGRWELSNSMIETTGAHHHNALVCANSAFVSCHKCTFGGVHVGEETSAGDLALNQNRSSKARSISFANNIQKEEPPAENLLPADPVRDNTVDDIRTSAVCQNAIFVTDGSDSLPSTVFLNGCSLHSSYSAAIRCGPHAMLSSIDCFIFDCAAVLDVLGGTCAKMEFNNTKLRAVSKIWVDMKNRPRQAAASFLDIDTVDCTQSDEGVVIELKDWHDVRAD